MYISKGTHACFRIMEELNEKLFKFRYEEIRKMTGCVKPCKYHKYTVSFDGPSIVETPHFTFSVAVSMLTRDAPEKRLKISIISHTSYLEGSGYCSKYRETIKASANVTLVEHEELIFSLASLVSYQHQY